MSRSERKKLYSLAVVLDDENYWLQQGYTIDYSKNLLVKIDGGK